MTVIGRRSAASVDRDGGAGLVGVATGSVPSRLAIAFSRRLRCPRVSAELFEVGVRQVAQHLGVDVILAK